MNHQIINFSAIFLYLASAVFQLIRCRQRLKLTGSTAKSPEANLAMALGFLGLGLHAIGLYLGMFSSAGINLGFYNALSLVSAFIVLLTLIASTRHPVQIMLVALLPVTALAVLVDTIAVSDHLIPPESASELTFHILTSIIAYSLLALAALQAILIAIQNHLLHNHQTTGILNILPPLKNMEKLLFEIILVGFITLTISLGSGLIFLENMFAQQVAHKTVLSIIAWAVFLILLIGHWRLGWRGKTAIRWTLSGFVSLMLAYFGSKFVLEILLN
jgi:ABC-type uncharacterized transport system permease subunit